MGSVTLRDIRKRFGRHEAIRGIDLDIAEGEFVVIVGPSGCGKSTLLRLIAGLEEISGGDLTIGGVRVNDMPPARRGIAMVFQSYALYPHMTAYENMAFGMTLARADRAEIDERVRRAAEILELGDLLDRLPRALSGGQRQRVAIGRAIVRDPAVFLFDEPLSNLDAALRTQTRAEIARLQERLGTTTIYVTHDQVEAMTLADRIVVLNEGRVEQVGTPLELYHRPTTRFVAGFIGAPQMNFLPARIATLERGQAEVELTAGGRLSVAVDGRVQRGSVVLGIRPEHLSEARDGPIEAEVDLVEELGESHNLHMRLTDGTAIILRGPGEARRRRGETLRLAPADGACHLFGEDGLALARSDVAEAPAPAGDQNTGSIPQTSRA